jgi:3-methyladenine DNA glycosylase AlkD
VAVLEQVREALKAVSTTERAKANAWFFKTGPGQYGEGDQFLGVTVPQQRAIAKKFYKTLSFDAMEQLILSPWHEERLTGLFIMVLIYQNGDQSTKDKVANLYLANTRNINNWDLVDSSACYILGPWLDKSPYKMKLLTRLAKSENLWDRRIAVLSTFYYIKHGSTDEAFKIIEILKNDRHDLIQKALGWMLREIGKNCGEKMLTGFLDDNAKSLPRTTLRYSIERLSTAQRKTYMQK